jgi:hypothetical protein
VGIGEGAGLEEVVWCEDGFGRDGGVVDGGDVDEVVD